MAAATRTVCPSSRHYAFPSAPSPSRALFPPDGDDTIWRLWCHAIGELIRRLLPPRKPRVNPRVVKRKYTKWHVKRTRHQPMAPTQPATRTGRGDLIERYC